MSFICLNLTVLVLILGVYGYITNETGFMLINEVIALIWLPMMVKSSIESLIEWFKKEEDEG